MPVYTFNTGGVKGGLHQINFEVTNEEEAYIDTAKMFALAAYGLLKGKLQRSKELVKKLQTGIQRFCRIYKIYGAV